MRYARVVDGEVVEAGPLPAVWRLPDGSTVHGFPLLDPADHRAAGWWPVDDQRPTPGAHQTLGPTTWTIDADGVTATADLIDVPADPADPADALASLVAAVGVEGVVRSAVLGADLAGRADDLWTALAAMSPSNTARPAIEIVTDSALTAALTPLDPPTQEEP